MGPGVLGHDQHRHLRARAGSAEARPDRPALRLLEGALPAPARDGAPPLRARAGRLLARHRHHRPVPAGELRRAGGARAPQHPRHPATGQRLGRRGRRDRRRRGGRGPRVRRQLLPPRPRLVGRRVHRALEQRHIARAGAHRAVRDRRLDTRRPLEPHRGRDRRAELRHPRPRADPRGRGDRRRGDDRLRGERHAGRADLPVQGGRDRRADPREPDPRIARDLAAVRPGRRLRPRQRRPDPGDRGAACRRARHCTQARRARRRQPRLAGGVPDAEAGHDLRPQLDRRRRRGPARARRRRSAAT